MITNAKLNVGCTIGRYILKKNAVFFKKKCFFMYYIKIRAHKLPNSPHFCLYLKNTIISFAVLGELSNFVSQS